MPGLKSEFLNTHVYTHTHTHARTHARTHTHTHTYQLGTKKSKQKDNAEYKMALSACREASFCQIAHLTLINVNGVGRGLFKATDYRITDAGSMSGDF